MESRVRDRIANLDSSDLVPSKRKYRRFELSLPVKLKVSSVGVASEIQAKTKNVSIGGLLLETQRTIPFSSDLSFTITMEPSSLAIPIKLAGKGRVVRIEPRPEDKFEIAIQCLQPISEMSRHFPK